VVFGASGDLTARKLFPAVWDLFVAGRLPEGFAILGCARTGLDHAAFRERMRAAVADRPGFDPAAWEAMARRIFYQPLDYARAEDFTALAALLATLDRDLGLGGCRLFYLAVPPAVYRPIAANLGSAGLAREGEGSFARLVIEKPFGHDLPSALELDRALHAHFAEGQIFRIDHYLAKETVQNILLLRFANAVFEPLWNRRYVESVLVASLETLGVEHRAGFYESAGVLRDMFQNHMMQLASLCAMEPPTVFSADRVRDEKAKVYRSLRPFDPARLHEDLILGQYGPGPGGVRGYREEEGVSPRSLTPTFALLRAHIDNWRWQGVPFWLVSGKRLASKLTRIVVRFRPVPHAVFGGPGGLPAPNRLVLDIAPDNAISLHIQTKQPGPAPCLRPSSLHFDFRSGSASSGLDAYGKVLLDVMLGDQTLFWRQDGVEECWGYLTPILELCEACGDRAARLHPYPAGALGPEAALDVMRLLE
jgi:glucose-6-phosphate 1-dehydrogenase